MRPTLALLIITSLCSLSVGHEHVCHFINQNKTWAEAKDFCKKHYTDLATVKDQNNLRSVFPSDSFQPHAWVNQCNEEDDTTETEWSWIDGQILDSSEAHWYDKPPHNKKKGSCVYVHLIGDDSVLSWSLESCFDYVPDARVICYTGSNYTVITESVSWFQAKNECRDKMLVGHDRLSDPDLICKIKDKGPSLKWWIGLSRDHRLVQNGTESNCSYIGPSRCESTHCWQPKPFICCDDDMVLVTENKTWEEALVFCRKNYSDLAMMTDENQLKMVQNKVKMAETEFVWVGLLYACFFEEWIWVNGHWVSSDNENWQIRKERHDCGFSGAMQKNQKKWVKMPLGEQYNFVCSIHH